MVNLSENILITDEQCSIRCVPPGFLTPGEKSNWRAIELAGDRTGGRSNWRAIEKSNWRTLELADSRTGGRANWRSNWRANLPTIFRIQKFSHLSESPRNELIPRLIAKVG
jgi:hypothetical protein